MFSKANKVGSNIDIRHSGWVFLMCLLHSPSVKQVAVCRTSAVTFSDEKSFNQRHLQIEEGGGGGGGKVSRMDECERESCCSAPESQPFLEESADGTARPSGGLKP